ncbi:MAG: Hsp70 family protein [Planctomycetaceae bacterium]|nr:Hsp70 family protein [Planctomycetaceae bacterium]
MGIDLGTTNSAVCYVDTAAVDIDLCGGTPGGSKVTPAEAWRVNVLSLPQLVAPGQVEARETLPSFHYQAADGEFSDGSLQLPWQQHGDRSFVGILARDHGIQVPGRLIASAKSWLCHPGVDRTAGILPWQGGDDVDRMSPVEVSSRYLRHMVACWNHRFPEHPAAEQTIVLTIPASFDEVARNLTIQAARRAGLERVLLIEEPQAAFYAWIDRHRDQWEQHVAPGQKILVCDVGGGTSDFTLIRVRTDSDGRVVFHRVAVGEHLILGGDNLDLALAGFLEQKLTEQQNVRIGPHQWSVLVRTARQVKESLLSESGPDSCTVSVPGSGSRLIAGSLQITVSRDEVRNLLLEGFLPLTKLSDVPQQMQSGFREFGLPYAPDTAITRYLSRFLRSHAEDAADNALLKEDQHPARPDIILFNGGLFESSLLRQRLVDCVSGWFTEDAHDPWRPIILDSARLDLAVAHGAACYGMVSRGIGVRISAGLPRTYYVGVEASADQAGCSAVCLVPAGTEPGEPPVQLEHTFQLQTNTPVEFPVYYSGRRLTDAVGTTIAADPEQLTALPPIRTVIRRAVDGAGSGETTEPIRLNARITEVGTLDLWCSSLVSEQKWKLQFDVRSATRTDLAAHQATVADEQGIVDQATISEIEAILHGVFGSSGTEKAGGLASRIAKQIGQSRDQWPTSLLREIWRMLIDLADGRRRSAAHEAAWLNLTGWCLRPGFGFALDDWRIDTTWDLLNGKLIHSTPDVRCQWWIFWRRAAGGLSGGQQNSLASPLLSSIRQTAQQMSSGRGKGGVISLHDKDAAECWRLLGAFEQLPPGVRRELGDIILQFLSRPRMQPVLDPMIWTLGRLGSRIALNGNPQSIVSPETARGWLQALLSGGYDRVPSLPLAIMQMARRTNDRMLDLPEHDRQEAALYLQEMNAPEHLLQLIREGGATDAETRTQLFGESLPLGLRFDR